MPPTDNNLLNHLRIVFECSLIGESDLSGDSVSLPQPPSLELISQGDEYFYCSPNYQFMYDLMIASNNNCFSNEFVQKFSMLNAMALKSNLKPIVVALNGPNQQTEIYCSKIREIMIGAHGKEHVGFIDIVANREDDREVIFGNPKDPVLGGNMSVLNGNIQYIIVA